jgi:hypothetical protein
LKTLTSWTEESLEVRKLGPHQPPKGALLEWVLRAVGEVSQAAMVHLRMETVIITDTDIQMAFGIHSMVTVMVSHLYLKSAVQHGYGTERVDLILDSLHDLRQPNTPVMMGLGEAIAQMAIDLGLVILTAHHLQESEELHQILILTYQVMTAQEVTIDSLGLQEREMIVLEIAVQERIGLEKIVRENGDMMIEMIVDMIEIATMADWIMKIEVDPAEPVVAVLYPTEKGMARGSEILYLGIVIEQHREMEIEVVIVKIENHRHTMYTDDDLVFFGWDLP